MLKRTRLWHSMSVCTIAGASLLSGCQSSDDAASDTSAQNQQAAAETASGLTAAPPTASGEGEAEGEGEGRMAVDLEDHLRSNDAAYLGQLDLISGHLLVGMKLFEQGSVEAARTHMKHPGDELYSQLKAAFSSRNLPGFSPELEALANAMAGGEDVAAARQAYADLQQAMREHESAVNDARAPAMLLQRVTQLLRTAADEYAIGIVAGKVDNVHEYQDAWGFTDHARSLLQSSDHSDAEVQQAIQRALTLLNGLRPLWPGLIPPPQVSGDASELYGAAARIEFIASGLSDGNA